MKKRYYIILIILLLSEAGTIQAQLIHTKLDITGGIGYPEYLHAGLRYQYLDVAQLGIFYGGDAGLEDAIVNTWTFDNLIHFGKNNYFSNRPVWYARTGFTYSIHTESDRVYKYSYIDLGAGRDLQLSDWIGINLDMGFFLQVREKTEFKNGSEPWFKNNWHWNPIMRMQVYFSI